MTIALVFTAVVFALLMTLTTLMQMFYLETLRLRTRELPSFQFFRESLEDRLGLKAENGALTFSLIKHSILALTGAVYLALTTVDDRLSTQTLLEAFGLSWATMLVVNYLLPQMLYRRTSGAWLLFLLPVIRGLVILVRPLTAFLAFLQSIVQLGEHAEPGEENGSHQENIEALITAGAEEGIIEEEDRRLIQSVVAFGSKTVREIMTPRPSMVCIPAESTLDDLRQLVINEQFSRVPVYEDSIDRIIGFVHVRDMFELDSEERSRRKVRELVRPARFIPETKSVNDLLREMQQDGAHMAIVIDEYGNTAGIATLEDMVEEIVGEIRDEHEPTLDVERQPDGAFIVSGSFDLDGLYELLDFRPQTDTESTTVGGLVTEWMGHVPLAGESVEQEGIRIEVLAANDLRVEQVRICHAKAGHDD